LWAAARMALLIPGNVVVVWFLMFGLLTGYIIIFCDDIHYVSANITHFLKLTKQFAQKA